MQPLAQSAQVVFQVRVQRSEVFFLLLDLSQDLARQGPVQEAIPRLYKLHQRGVMGPIGWFGNSHLLLFGDRADARPRGASPLSRTTQLDALNPLDAG